jgi:hypothetical protein
MPRVHSFNLRQLFVVTTVAAVTLGSMRIVSGFGLFIPFIWLYAVKCCPDDIKRRKFSLATAFLGSGAPLHCWCCLAAFETLGEVLAPLCYFTLILQILPFACCALGILRPAIFISSLLTILIAPPQVMWHLQLGRLQSEVSRIVRYAESVKSSTGNYPAELSEYDPASKPLMHIIQYDCSNNHIIVHYGAGNGTAPHWYSATSGWGYDPD